MLYKLPLLLAMTVSALLTGCNDDDPVNDKGIAAVMAFDIDDHPQIVSTDLAGVWVAVGTGSFERDKPGKVKFGKQSAKIYFLIKGSAGSYTYANCFDEGYLEGGFDRGGFETLSVTGSSIVFHSKDSAGNESADDADTHNSGTITDHAQINTRFTFTGDDSVETNDFVMHKVSNDAATALGTSIFKETNQGDISDTLACFAQWSGAYSTSDGLYTVARYDASFIDDSDPFSASEYESAAEDISEYSVLSYNGTPSVNTQNSDRVIFYYLVETLNFGVVSSGSSVEKSGTINIDHANL